MIFCFDWSLVLRLHTLVVDVENCIYSWRGVEDLKRWIHTWDFVCGPKWGSSPYFGSCIHWTLFMLKAKNELYKTDKERTQVNRLLDFMTAIHDALCLCWSRVLKLAVYIGRRWCWVLSWWTKQERFLLLLGGLAIWRRERPQLKGADWYL
jgi:hypothetical protein